MSGFDWRAIDLPEGTPLQEACAEPAHLRRGLFRCSESVYAVTNVHVFGGTEENPGVGGFLWAASERAAIRVYDSLAADAPSSPPAAVALPPGEVLGLDDVTWRGISGLALERGDVSVKRAWTIPDGRFTSTRVAMGGRTWYFGAEEPVDDEQPIAIRFHLPSVAAA